MLTQKGKFYSSVGSKVRLGNVFFILSGIVHSINYDIALINTDKENLTNTSVCIHNTLYKCTKKICS